MPGAHGARNKTRVVAVRASTEGKALADRRRGCSHLLHDAHLLRLLPPLTQADRLLDANTRRRSPTSARGGHPEKRASPAALPRSLHLSNRVSSLPQVCCRRSLHTHSSTVRSFCIGVALSRELLSNEMHASALHAGVSVGRPFQGRPYVAWDESHTHRVEPDSKTRSPAVPGG